MPATYDCIATTTLGASTSSVTFTNIPQTYTDLVVIFTGTNTTATLAMTGEVDINGDGGNNYSSTWINTSDVSGRGVGNNGGYIGALNRSGKSWYVLNFINYSNTTTFKSWISCWATMGGEAPDSGRIIGMWRNTSAITQLNFNRPAGESGSFDAGCTWSLYGIKAA